MNEGLFRRVLEECLERVRQGDSVEACLAANPEHAAQLGPYLSAAFMMRQLTPPQPAAATVTNARNRLLARVADGTGKETVMRGIFKFSHAAMAVAAVFVMSLGLVAAAGSGVLTGGSNGVTFNARVVVTNSTLSFVQREDDQSYVYLRFNNDTRFEDPSGAAITWSGIARNSRVSVEATPSAMPRFFDTRLVRMIGATSTPTVAATPAPTPEPTAVPAPTDEPKPEPTQEPKPEPTHEPKPEPTHEPKPEPQFTEFYGVVVEMGESHLVVATDGGNVVVHTSNETQFPNGRPFVGVKVYVAGYKNDDGSVSAVKVMLKATEFSGKVTAISGSDIIVFADGDKTVHTNEHTAFPAGQPKVNDFVYVRAWKLGDGTFLATEVKVKSVAAPSPSFSGVIVGYFPEQFTICVKVAGHSGAQDGPCIGFGSDVKTVCYEFAAVEGELAVGKTVDVYKDHLEGNTYFAYKVVVK